MAVVGDIGRELLRERRAGIEERGDQLLFYLRALAWTPRAVTRYRREVLNTHADDFNGALTVIDQLGEPDSPSLVLAGAAIKDSYISVNTLKDLHGKAFAN